MSGVLFWVLLFGSFVASLGYPGEGPAAIDASQLSLDAMVAEEAEVSGGAGPRAEPVRFRDIRDFMKRTRMENSEDECEPRDVADAGDEMDDIAAGHLPRPPEELIEAADVSATDVFSEQKTRCAGLPPAEVPQIAAGRLIASEPLVLQHCQPGKSCTPAKGEENEAASSQRRAKANAEETRRAGA